jgi:hypothetical protein
MHHLILFNLTLASITLFRFVVYAIPQGLYYATKVKIHPKYWSNKNIQEIAFYWTKAIRLMNFTRLLFVLCVVLGSDIYTNWLHLIISFLFDIYLLYIMTIKDIFKSNKNNDQYDGPIKHDNVIVPQSIQSLLVILEVLFIVYHEFHKS